jgi:hypothetical protein
VASTKPLPSELYDGDYYAWIQEQVSALRQRRIEDVDWDNVAEEVEDLGKSERRSIQSQLETIIEHLLELAYTRGATRIRNARLWKGSANVARMKLTQLLEESPSLRTKLEELFAKAYRTGRIRALSTSKLPDESIPALAPWPLSQVMNDDFMPNPDD